MRDFIYGKLDRGPIEFGSRRAEKEREVMKIARRNVVTVPPTINIKGAAETMLEYNVRRLPIVQPGSSAIKGIVITRDIIDFLGGGESYNLILQKHKGNFLAAINESVREIMSKDVIAIRDDYSVGTTLTKLVDENVGGFPILNKYDKVVGIVEEEDFVYNIAGVWSGISVSETMTSDVITITPGTTLKDTSRFMIKNYRRRLPVMSEGELIGIVSTFDIIEYFGSSLMLERMKTSAEDALSIRIQELMNKNPITIAPDADIGQAVDLMKRSGIGFLPVVQDHDIRGVITERDILLKLIEEEYA